MINVKGKPPSFPSTLLVFFNLIFFSDCTNKTNAKKNPIKNWSFLKIVSIILKNKYKLSIKP